MNSHHRFPILYINLDRRPDRRAKVESETPANEFDLTRIAATDGMTLATNTESMLLAPGQVACWKSHQSVFRHQIANDLEYVLVLEDDADLATSGLTAEMLDGLCGYMRASNIRLLQLGYLDRPYPVFHRHFPLWALGVLGTAILNWRRRKFRKISVPGIRTRQLVMDSFNSGSHAYLLNIEAARLLKDLNDPTVFPVDNYLGLIAESQNSQLRAARTSKSLVNQWTRTGMHPDEFDSDIR